MANALLYNENEGYIDGILRGYYSGILNSSQYLNFTQCETLEGKVTIDSSFENKTQQEQHITDNVHGWLMNVPHYRQDHSQDYLKKQRHLSTASISSEDSVNLDELINGNFTTSMEEETDLNDLSLLDLDDSKEDFWKVDNIYIPTPTTFNKQKLEPSYYHKDSSRSRELGILDDIFQKV
ncbi:Putative ATP synthase (C/AC39) subunit [Rhizopus microsporus]|nr:Putative ATP synthase (C/AC39) subunit [Rhizopus microsporus]